MTKPAVEFQISDNELHLIYRPRDNTSWVREMFERDRDLVLKGTFHLTSAELVEDAVSDNDNTIWNEDDRLIFCVATAEGVYFRFKPQVLDFETPVLQIGRAHV